MDKKISNGLTSQNSQTESIEAEFNQNDYRLIGKQDIHYLKQMTLKSARSRYRLCLHSDQTHLTQEMIICMKGFNYLQPHLHPSNRSESYHLIEGMLDVYLFDEQGGLIDIIKLSGANTPQIGTESRNFMYRLSAPIYHLMIPRTEWLVYHEVTTGPWNREAAQFASFAPSGDERGEVQKFIKQVTGFAIEELTS